MSQPRGTSDGVTDMAAKARPSTPPVTLAPWFEGAV